MKLKHIISSLAMISGVAIAATQMIAPLALSAEQEASIRKRGDEKVNLGGSFYAGLQRVEESIYPRLSLAGAADGVPYGLRCDEVKDKTVKLSWNTPEAVDGYFDDFEDHDDFAINSAGKVGWSYIDGDNKNTYTWSATTFKNQGKKMAFIVMNPSECTPSVEANPKYVPASGKKMLVSMCAIDAPNNDWLISPELNFNEDFKFSFRAKSYRTDGITPERIRVGYSTSGKSQSSFTFVTPAPYLELPDTWNLYEYTIPKNAKYVTINCVSDDAFMLLIDDIMIGTNEIRPNIGEDPNIAPHSRNNIAGKHLTGFNVYRDGKKVNNALITEVRYTDEADTYAMHKYTVTGVYSDGTESAQSEGVDVDVVDPRLLPFFDDFDDWTLHEDKWSTPENPTGTESYWGIDYYTYGLIDPSATYQYSSLHNYDQSLITRELRTLDRASTYIRFDLRLCNWGQYDNEVSYLALEITCDDGKTWTTIDTYDNSNGEFNWTTKLYSLKDYLKNDYFKLRWRAYGVYALHIDYWYVDDVKVWNPSWGSLKMNVKSADGPVAGATVKLTGDLGSTQEVVTDKDGNIAIGQIEEDHYAINVTCAGYNVYNGETTIKKNETATTSIQMQRPVIELSAKALKPELSVEGKATETFTIKNTGDGPLTWRMDYAPAKQSGTSLGLELNRTWQASGDVQSCIAFDGQYYYTSSWYYLGEFWKYDREGNLVEQFRIPEMYYRLYDLAFDGRYFYGSDYSNRLFQLDFDNKRIVDIIEITNAPDLQITHVAYNPNNDRFYVGGWNSLCEVRRNGRTSSMAVAFDENHGHSIFGSAYDNVTPGGPYLWLAAEESYNENMIDQVVIYQYNLNTKTFTGLKKAVTDLPGYKVGNAQSGRNNICGIEGSYDIASGKFTLVGVVQQSPCLFFEYNVAETDTWLDYSPKKATLQPGESTTITVNFDARNAEVGKEYTRDINITTIPELGKQTISLGFKASKASATPRPTDLKADNTTAQNVVLTWVKPAKEPTSYNIYSNGNLIASKVKGTTYTVQNVIRGTYTYEVTAVYDAGESVKSDAATITVIKGAPYFPPLDLASTLKNNKNVTLTWQSPLQHAQTSTTLSWSDGRQDDQVGLTSGGTMYAGSRWTAEDIVNHRNKQIASASIRIVNPVTYLAVCIFKDGKVVARQQYTDKVIYGEWNTVTLKEPITIEAGSEYIVGFQIEHAEGLQPVAIDGTKTIDNKGNMLSMDGEYWFPATQMGIEGNMCIRFDVKSVGAKETAPTGYNIYRTLSGTNDTKKVGTTNGTTLTYTDNITEGGTYTYTVTSVYEGGESAPSNTATAKIIAIGERLAPNEFATDIECNREVTLDWGYPIKGKSSFPIDLHLSVTTPVESYPSYVNAFIGVAGEMGIASDCKYIYTSVHSESGRINKYDLNGNFIEHFYIQGLDGIRNITYDGHDFWVSTVDTYIYKVDMQAHTVIEKVAISEYARHLTYIPELDGGKGGFETGDWTTSIFINRQGATLYVGPTLKAACGTACYDGKLYAFEQGGSNPYTIGIYDMETLQRTGSIDLARYTGLNTIESASAGGMSIIRTPEGLTILAVAIQNSLAYTQFLLLDLSNISGVSGYNVFRNGTKVNTKTLRQRHFAEILTEEGTYDYQVQTIYIDGTVSDKSAAQKVTILPIGTTTTPIDLKAVQTTYGYNVAISYVDANLAKSAPRFESFEAATTEQGASIDGWTNTDNLWTVTTEGYHGTKSITADRDADARFIIPVESMKWVGLFAKNSDDHLGDGNIQILSCETDNADDFILIDEFATSEVWTSCGVNIPEGTRYVMVRKPAGSPRGFIDAIRLAPSQPSSDVYGYEILRDGKVITTAKDLRTISYMDHNLRPGTYSYQVRQTSVTAAVSELSEPVVIDIEYSNGGQAPENFRLIDMTDQFINLAWDAPALGEAVTLKWHSGNIDDAAGLPSGGAFYAGVRWLASDLRPYAHLTLSEVELYINQIPDALYILIYQGNDLKHYQYVDKLKQYTYNNITLSKHIPIDITRDMRVIVYVEHNEITIPIGYDEGPAVTGRGNIYSTDGITWTTLDGEDSGIGGNWNISLGLKPYADDDARSKAQRANNTIDLEGYNIYANNRLVTETPIQATECSIANDYLVYPFVQLKLAAVYSELGEVFAPTITASITDIEATMQSDIKVGSKDGSIRMMGVKPNTLITICDASGIQVYNSPATTSGLMAIPMAPGHYIVTIGNLTWKVSVR